MEPSPEEQAQKEDEQKLAENSQRIEEILKLIEDRTDREEARRRVADAEARVDARHQGKVFHDHASKKVPLYGHTSNLLRLAAALELQWRTRRHGEDLHRALSNLSVQRVKVLQRIIKRGLF